MTTDDVCPICKRAKASGGAGSITQWIVACQCGINDDVNELSDQIKLCKTCGKRIDRGRVGSITQFIFRSDSCRCELPKSLDQALKESEKFASIPVSEQSPAADEVELELDKDSFPLERYSPLIQLGSGGSGVVFLARDRMLKKRVAIKVLRMMAPDSVISFQSEARTTSKLKHKYIVDLLDFGVTSGGSPYMVLEYIVGQSLAETIDRIGPLSLLDFFSVFQRVCEALVYAHRNSVFHRDLKPENIILTSGSDGKAEVRIIDFGLAKILTADQEQSDRKGKTLAGTPLYMSPDQGLGRTFDARSEIYSLGCVMFESLTGKPPFKGDSALELLSQHAEQPPPTLSEAASAAGLAKQNSFPKAVENLIQTCLAKKPDDRFQSMNELIEALRNAEIACFEEQYRDADGRPDAKFPERSQKWIKIGLGVSAISLALIGYIGLTNFDEQPVKEVDQQIPPPRRPSLIESVTTLRNLADTSAEKIKINGGLGDNELKELRLYKNAREIDISNNLISDQATSYINSPHLERLRLNNTNVRTLKYVSRLKSLIRLDVGGSSVNGDAIKMLALLPNLEVLGIRNTEIKDEDLEKLCAVKSLIFVDFRDSDFSPEAIENLSKKMPACRFGQRPNQLPLQQYVLSGELKKNKNIIEQIEQSIRIIENAQGKDAPLLATCYFMEGHCYEAMKQFDEAKKCLNRSLAISKKTGYMVHVLDALATFRQIAAEQNDKKSQKYYLEQQAIQTKVIKGFTVDYCNLAYSAAEAAFHRKENDSAEQWYHELLQGYDSLLERGVEVPVAMETAAIPIATMRLALIAHQRGDAANANRYVYDATKFLEKHPGKGPEYSRAVAFVYYEYGLIARAHGNKEIAIGALEKCVAEAEKHPTIKSLDMYREALAQTKSMK